MRSLPPSLLPKLQSKLQTIANNATPKMNVAVARAKSTVVDSSYWTVETIRTGATLGDVSVAPRRFNSYGTPNRIYEIHVINGEVKTSIREYPDKLKDGWQDQFSLGTGSAVAMAFNGHWERYRNRLSLVTDESPWITWVDGSGKLWTQLWDDTTTKTEMDTSVVKVRAIRAWKNTNFADKDHGIVVGYIKTDGSLWYRNYCQQSDNSYLWESAKQVTEFTSVGVALNLFITNDYRMGFIVEDNLGQIHWILTHRNWAGMAVLPENIAIRTTADVEFVQVDYIRTYEDEYIDISTEVAIEMLFGRTDNSLVELINIADSEDDWGFKVKVRLLYKSENTPTFALTDLTTSSAIAIESVEVVEEGFEYVLNIDPIIESGINNALGDIGITVTSFINEAGYDYETINDSFTPINLEPTGAEPPSVEVIYNE